MRQIDGETLARLATVMAVGMKKGRARRDIYCSLETAKKSIRGLAV